MIVYRVEVSSAAKADLAELMAYLITVQSREGSHRYVNAMYAEVLSLAIYADLYPPTRYADIRRFHPQARRMNSHNKKWVYIFHIEGDVVVVDRIRPAKLITK